jgi:hypothetical protein
MARRDEAPKPQQPTTVQLRGRDEENLPSLPKERVRFIRAFSRIENPAMRNAIIELVEKLADNQI